MKPHLCPICKTYDWDEPVYYAPCLGGCGLARVNQGLMRTLNTYTVYWRDDFSNEDSVSTVWKNDSNGNERVYRGPGLPYDITEDMIRIILTFS